MKSWREENQKNMKFCRNYLHQQLMDHFKDESSYWSFFRSNELGNPTDPINIVKN